MVVVTVSDPMNRDERMSDVAPGRGRRVTLSDVARQAEVSLALVSIVMRNAPGASETTRARVLAVAGELGYRPDARARSLAGLRSRMVGVMFGVGFGSFHFDLLEGLYDAAEERGGSLILTPVTRHRDEARAANSLQDFGFDGLIMLGPPTAQPVLAGRVPIVVVGWHVDDPRVDVVRTSDDPHGAGGRSPGHARASPDRPHRRRRHGDLARAVDRRFWRRCGTRPGRGDPGDRGGESQRDGHVAARELIESTEGAAERGDHVQRRRPRGGGRTAHPARHRRNRNGCRSSAGMTASWRRSLRSG